ncbi:MAG: Sodium/glucose cotransporter [Candidatus Scalindua arabica]|uniref:Sodium/glucose cotransporter n=1 Tax=Candidatus Scalindua arabica TaxID=1127984 RepID=A0A941W479_9BACT|nr:Sodium/glucose cotransporter [Candidatus Scalindua arabica]
MISVLDWVVLLIYAGVVIAFGIIAGKKEGTTEDYFLGGRKMPWLSVMISIYATSLSALTFIGVPGAAFGGDFVYIQLAIGDLVGRVLVSTLLLTAYYKGRVTTIYEFLGNRFGPRSRDAGTGFFILTRLLASGVRLAGCAIALSVVFEIPLNSAIVIIAVVALVYTTLGGIKAVIWTDALQFFLLLGGAIVTLFFIWSTIPGGFSEFFQIGSEFEKFRIFHVSASPSHPEFFFNLNNPNALAAGLLFGCFTTFAVLGTDQDLVQRMLTCDHVKKGQKALLWTAALNFPITLLFLGVGAALFAYYKVAPDAAVDTFIATHHNDYIFPHFIKTVLTPGLRGLLIAALLAAAMSSLDSALNALSSTFYIDIYKRYIRPETSEKHAVTISRYSVIIFAAVLALVAMQCGKTESVLWLGFKIFGYTYGAMIGVFLIAVLTDRRGNDIANVVIMVTSVLMVLFLTADSIGPLQEVRSTILSPLGIEKISWKWSIILGSIWTFGIGIIFSQGKCLK